MALSHRVNRTRGDPFADQRALTERFYMFRGKAIRSLRQCLNTETHYTDDTIIAGIVTLLLADVSTAPSRRVR